MEIHSNTLKFKCNNNIAYFLLCNSHYFQFTRHPLNRVKNGGVIE